MGPVTDPADPAVDQVRALADQMIAEAGGDARKALDAAVTMYFIARRCMTSGFGRMPPAPDRR